MGLSSVKIDDALANVNRIGIDSSILIYYAEGNPQYLEQTTAIFKTIRDRSMVAVTSVLTITEVFSKPLTRMDMPVIRRYRELLFRSKQLTLPPVTSTLSYRAASLRAAYNLRTPDAIQVATALVSRCDAFLTNDIALKRVTDLTVLVLNELEST